jgi:hypothetical protein
MAAVALMALLFLLLDSRVTDHVGCMQGSVEALFSDCQPR